MPSRRARTPALGTSALGVERCQIGPPKSSCSRMHRIVPLSMKVMGAELQPLQLSLRNFHFCGIALTEHVEGRVFDDDIDFDWCVLQKRNDVVFKALCFRLGVRNALKISAADSHRRCGRVMSTPSRSCAPQRAATLMHPAACAASIS